MEVFVGVLCVAKAGQPTNFDPEHGRTRWKRYAGRLLSSQQVGASKNAFYFAGPKTAARKAHDMGGRAGERGQGCSVHLTVGATLGSVSVKSESHNHTSLQDKRHHLHIVFLHSFNFDIPTE